MTLLTTLIIEVVNPSDWRKISETVNVSALWA